MTLTKTASILIAALVPLVILAFWPMYLSRPFSSSDRYTHFHTLAGTLWLGILIAQPIAVHNYRYGIHRALGRISYVLAPLFFLAGILLSHHRLVSMDEATFAAEGYSHFLPFYASIVFVTAYLFGLAYRHLSDVHGRFMLLTAIPLFDPVLGRVLYFYFPPLPHPLLYQAITFSVQTIVAATIVFSYRGSGPTRRALLAYFAILVALEIGWVTIARTGIWLDIVSWYRGLPLT